MKTFIRSVFLTLGAFAASSCLDYTPTNTGTSATNFAWIQGRVFTASGQGVPSAQVGVRIPSGRMPSAYALQGGTSNTTGDYDLIVGRVADVGTLPPVDTLTVYVLVAQQGLSGTTRLDSAQATLRFWPTGTVADPQKVDLHTSAP